MSQKLLELLSEQEPAPPLSNTQLIMLMYPRSMREVEADFLIGTYMDLVDREVVINDGEHSEGSFESQGEHFDEQGCARDLISAGLVITCRGLRWDGGQWRGKHVKSYFLNFCDKE